MKKIDEKLKIPFLLDEVQRLIDEGKFKTAISRLKRMKKIIPKNHIVLGSLAKCYFRLGKLKEAEEAMRERFANNRDLTAYILYVQILLAKEKPVEAEVLVREMNRLFGGVVSNGLLAEVLRKQKRYTESLEITERMTEKNYSILLCRAYCLMHLRREKESLESFQEAEKTLVKGNGNQQFDFFLRLYNGYIFLFQYFSGDENEMAKMKKEAQRASQWLKAFDKNKIGRLQVTDYANAMKIIAEKEL